MANKYKLLKDIPGANRGDIVKLNYWEGKGHHFTFQYNSKPIYFFLDKDNIDTTLFEPVLEYINNDNFLDYEVTLSLPKDNPYKIKDMYWIKSYPYSSNKKLTISHLSKSSSNRKCIDRDPWTWENYARYMKDNYGYFLEIFIKDSEYHYRLLTSKDNIEVFASRKGYETYQEAANHCVLDSMFWECYFGRK